MFPKKTRALIRPIYDPKKTPFLERKKDIARVYQALPASFNVAFAISALAGLRPGEVRALKWANVDLERRRTYVRESVNGPTKVRTVAKRRSCRGFTSSCSRGRRRTPAH